MQKLSDEVGLHVLVRLRRRRASATAAALSVVSEPGGP